MLFICWQERYHNINLLSWFFYISDLRGKKFKLVNLQFFLKFKKKRALRDTVKPYFKDTRLIQTPHY